MGLSDALSRLNGWQRIWVVLMVLGLLAIYPYAWVMASEHTLEYDYEVSTGFERPECAPVVAMQAGTDLGARYYGTPCSALYIYRTVYKDAANSRQGYIDHIKREQAEYRWTAYGWLLLVWAIMGALVYGVGAVIGWIVRGFRRG